MDKLLHIPFYHTGVIYLFHGFWTGPDEVVSLFHKVNSLCWFVTGLCCLYFWATVGRLVTRAPLSGIRWFAPMLAVVSAAANWHPSDLNHCRAEFMAPRAAIAIVLSLGARSALIMGAMAGHALAHLMLFFWLVAGFGAGVWAFLAGAQMRFSGRDRLLFVVSCVTAPDFSLLFYLHPTATQELDWLMKSAPQPYQK